MDMSVEGASLTRRRKKRPSRAEAEKAVRTLIEWAGDNPDREGLQDTPARVVRAYEEFYAGYEKDPDAILTRTFEEVAGFDDIVMLRDIPLESHCEHHMVPILGRAHIAYLPRGKIVGISKLARLVDIYGKRLQTQEVLTAQLADTIDRVLEPQGVAVLIEAAHQCMTTRGIRKAGVVTVTSRTLGCFRDDPMRQAQFLSLTSSATSANFPMQMRP